MYDDLLGPRKEKLILKKEEKEKCIGEDQQQNAKPTQPDKFDSHAKDHWANVPSDVVEEEEDELDLMLYEYEDEEDVEECDGGDTCVSCNDCDEEEGINDLG